MDANQFNVLANGISDLIQDIRADEATHRIERGQKEKVKEQVKAVKACDGTVAAEVREFLEDIELAIPLLQGIHGGIIDLVTKTVTGSLRKEVERFLSTQPNRLATPWNTLRNHIRVTFLSANEDERLKSELEKFAQPSYEPIPMFNRKFRDAANRAYPQPRTPDAERIVIRAYTRALYNSDIAKKLITDGHPANLEGAIAYTEQLAAGLELYDNMERPNRDEPMEIGSTKLSPQTPMDHLSKMADALEAIKLQNERLVTRVAKMEIEQEQQTKRQYGYQNRQACKFCGRKNHFSKNCFKNPDRKPKQEN